MFFLELIWWTITALVVAGVMYPIFMVTGNHYPFLWQNVINIVVFITLTRYIFLLKYTFLARPAVAKVVFIFLCIPLIAYLIRQLNVFQTFLDEQGQDALVPTLLEGDADGLVKYIRSEFLLFAVGSIVATAIFPIRLFISIWRMRNKGTI